MVDLRDPLRRHFGHPSFRPGQEDVVRAVLDGRDVLARQMLLHRRHNLISTLALTVASDDNRARLDASSEADSSPLPGLATCSSVETS
jgi:hypothetical protein